MNELIDWLNETLALIRMDTSGEPLLTIVRLM